MAVVPLHQLPLVAMEHVLSIMDPDELEPSPSRLLYFFFRINLSLTSAKSKRAVKNFLRINSKFEITLYISRTPHISISGDIKNWYFSKIDKPKKQKVTKSIKFFGIKDRTIRAFIKAYDYIKEVFGCQFDFVRFDISALPKNNKKIINWIQSQQESINSMVVRFCLPARDDDLKYLMANIKVTGDFIMSDNRHKQDFQAELPEGPRRLQIENAEFIKYDQFMKLDYKQINLSRVLFTSEEIHGFLKSWMACESHLNLKAIQIAVRKPDMMNNLKELAHEEVVIDGDLLQEFARYTFFFKKTNGFNIIRCDGKVATVHVQQTAVVSRLCFVAH
uniref:FBA_2 domain-containing protein n=1 Tax=Caenorhabditis tropicalis TaxID=1561998 RepID=A0A1I7TUJ4_9PELO